tara:strand:- start:15395 stop:15697 length:303 start_codon:yes stop_codon:yes gene_type:complete
MNIPKQVTIGGQKVKIAWGELDDCYGTYDHSRRKIILDKKLNNGDVLPTLRHELMHAAFDISGLSFCERWEEEAVVRCMEQVFFPAYERVLKRYFKCNQP